MIGTQLVYTNPGQQVLEFGADWQDTKTTFFEWTNYAPHAVTFQRAEVRNGTTAGTTTAPVVTITTPNSTHTLNVIPSGTATAALHIGSVDSPWEDRIEQGQTIKGVITATCSAGKEFTCRVYLGPCAPKITN